MPAVDSKISELPAATTTASGGDELPSNTEGAAPTKATQVAQVHSAVGFVGNRLMLTGAGHYVLSGVSRAYVGEITSAGPNIVGMPKQLNLGYTVPDGYFYDVMNRLTLNGSARLTVLGNADVVVNDDFRERSRIVLSGARV